MYRIRSASGTEAVYSSLEEFNAAVRRGAVSAEDEIFHTRANRWLDVKSHPHYRSALTWAGQGDASAASSPSAPASPRPMQAPVSTPPAAPQARPHAQVMERPAVRPPQTVLRPQLVSTAGPVAQRPAPAPQAPRKSQETAVIDTGAPAAPTTSQRNATVIEARKAPAAGTAAPKPEPKPMTPGTEIEFLVMDDGIESPVRTSSGHRTIPEDLELLFDRAAHPEKSGPGRTVVAAVPVPPKAQVEAPLAPPETTKKADAPTVTVPRVQAPGIAAPAPEAAPKAEPAHRPIPVVVPVPAAVTQPSVRTVEAPAREDLTIPGGPLLVDPTAASVTAPETMAPWDKLAAPGKSMGMLVGASMAVLVVVAGLLAWKPWSARVPSTDVATPPSPAAVPVQPVAATPAPTAPAPVPAPGTVPGKPAPNASGAPAAPLAAKPIESATKTDSSAVKPAEEEVMAAARPNFRADAEVPSADLGLGNDIRSAGTPVSAVAPSELTRRLEAAEEQAQRDLAAKLGGFRALLAENHLASGSGVAAARSAWGSGADAIRQYRARIAHMEKAYEDSVLTSQRSQRWSSEEMRAWAGHQSSAESVETSQLSDLMFNQVNEGLDLLAALDGQYEIKGTTIVFKNPASSTRYTSIRTWVDQRMQAWAATPESARAYTISAILRALGDGFPEAP